MFVTMIDTKHYSVADCNRNIGSAVFNRASGILIENIDKLEYSSNIFIKVPEPNINFFSMVRLDTEINSWNSNKEFLTKYRITIVHNDYSVSTFNGNNIEKAKSIMYSTIVDECDKNRPFDKYLFFDVLSNDTTTLGSITLDIEEIKKYTSFHLCPHFYNPLYKLINKGDNEPSITYREAPYTLTDGIFDMIKNYNLNCKTNKRIVIYANGNAVGTFNPEAIKI